jgi:hypothetical protein
LLYKLPILKPEQQLTLQSLAQDHITKRETPWQNIKDENAKVSNSPYTWLRILEMKQSFWDQLICKCSLSIP